jgi:hypothetical protein
VVTTCERFDEVNAATDKVEQNILWNIAARFSSSSDSGRIAASTLIDADDF